MEAFEKAGGGHRRVKRGRLAKALKRLGYAVSEHKLKACLKSRLDLGNAKTFTFTDFSRVHREVRTGGLECEDVFVPRGGPTAAPPAPHSATRKAPAWRSSTIAT